MYNDNNNNNNNNNKALERTTVDEFQTGIGANNQISRIVIIIIIITTNIVNIIIFIIIFNFELSFDLFQVLLLFFVLVPLLSLFDP